MTCPSCGSNRIVVVLSENRRSFCTRCGARWSDRSGEREKESHPATLSTFPGDHAS